MTKTDIRGVISPLIIPFTAEGGIDSARLKQYINWLLSNGVHGLFPLGSYGSGPLMNLDERKQCAEIIVEAVEGRVPIICHIGTQNTHDSTVLAKHAERIGMDAVASIPPSYYKHTPENIKAYYQDIINAVSTPVFAYNFPQVVGYEITVDLLVDLADMGLAGIKDSSLNLVFLQLAMNAVKKADFIWITGNPPIMFPAIMLGAVACIAGTANAFPEFTVSFWDTIQRGEYEKAAELQKKVTKLVQLLNMTTFVVSIHEILWLRDFDFGGFPRAPLKPCTGKQKEKLKEGLTELGLIK